MCKRKAPEAQISGPPNESKFRFLKNKLKNFFWIHINLALYAHWSYIQRCVQYGPQRPNFLTILGPKVSQILVFGHFLKKFSLVSHQYCFTCSLQILLDVWGIWASEAQFLGHLGPKISKKNPVLDHFLKYFPLVSHQFWCTYQFELLFGVLNISLRGPFSM